MRVAKQRGVVLIVVLWIVVLLTILLAAFTATVKVDRHVAADVLESVQARASADGVLSYLSALRIADPEQWSEMAGKVYKLQLNNMQLRFRIIPETAFVSLNGASVDLLERIFDTVQVPDARQLAELIVERRSGSMDEQTGEDVAPKLFTSVRSLAQLAQVSEEALQGIQYWFTADSDHEGVNLNFAESGLVYALAPDEAEAWLAARNEDDSPELDAMGNIFMQQEQGDSVRVQVELSSSASKRKIEATVAFDDGEQGYHVVRWNEYNAHFSLE